MSLNNFQAMKPDPVMQVKTNFLFDLFFRKYFKGKLCVEISKLDGRQQIVHLHWKKEALKQFKEAGVNCFVDVNLEQFNTQHETYVQKRVGVKILR